MIAGKMKGQKRPIPSYKIAKMREFRRKRKKRIFLARNNPSTKWMPTILNKSINFPIRLPSLCHAEAKRGTTGGR
jgi:hypothetical protein